MAAGAAGALHTHLPQWRRFADSHYLVEKRIAEGRTVTARHFLLPGRGLRKWPECSEDANYGETLEHAREMIEERIFDFL